MPPQPFKLSQRNVNWSVVVILSVAATGYLLIRNSDLLVDEIHNSRQIESYLHGVFERDPRLAVLPGYHLVIAALSYVFGVETISGLRLLSLIFGLVSAFVFYRCFTKLNGPAASLRTLDYFLLPILFPYFFLLYTDPFAMLLLLLAVHEYLEGRYSLAGVFCGLGVLVRQTQIVWTCMLLAMIYVDANGYKLTWAAVQALLKRCWVLVVVMSGFGIFVISHGEIAAGSLQNHPSFTWHLENIFFSLIVFFFLFLPLHLVSLPQMRWPVKQRYVLVVGCVVLAGIFMLTFTVDHPHNLYYRRFLRNRFLKIFTSNVLLQASLLIPIVWSTLYLSICPLHRKSQYLLYPFWVFSLLPVWLIEARYYIPAMTLFLLFKKPEQIEREKWLSGYFCLVSTILFFIIWSKKAFP